MNEEIELDDVGNKTLLYALIAELKRGCGGLETKFFEVALFQLGIVYGIRHPELAKTLIPGDMNLNRVADEILVDALGWKNFP